MIKRKYVISSSYNMSKSYSEDNKGIGLTPITFNKLVIELYHNPLFILGNKKLNIEEGYNKDIRVYSSITEGSYFYESKDLHGSRKLILNPPTRHRRPSRGSPP